MQTSNNQPPRGDTESKDVEIRRLQMERENMKGLLSWAMEVTANESNPVITDIGEDVEKITVLGWDDIQKKILDANSSTTIHQKNYFVKLRRHFEAFRTNIATWRRESHLHKELNKALMREAQGLHVYYEQLNTSLQETMRCLERVKNEEIEKLQKEIQTLRDGYPDVRGLEAQIEHIAKLNDDLRNRLRTKDQEMLTWQSEIGALQSENRRMEKMIRQDPADTKSDLSANQGPTSSRDTPSAPAPSAATVSRGRARYRNPNKNPIPSRIQADRQCKKRPHEASEAQKNKKARCN
uniref:Retrotrans_gag domain-containing protein n=1 Tax=Caenorhabditis tropicalis TaxID=1561998 RepID=A0A1I7UFX3_9PELO